MTDSTIKIPSIKLNAVFNVAKTFLRLFFPLITFPYASRILLPEGIGMVTFASSIVDFFIIIATLGISVYGIRETAKVRDNKEELSKVTKEIFTINVISTVVAYALLFSAIFIVPKLAGYRSLLILISAKILFVALGLEWLFSGLENYRYITIRAFVFQIISVALLFLFVKSQDDYLIYASIAVISNVGSNVCNWVYSKKFIDFSIVKKLDLSKHIKPIFVLFAMAAIANIYVVLDVTLLGFICGDREVGIYTTATKINRIVVQLVIAVGYVILPRLSYYLKNGDEKGFRDLVHKNFDVLFLFSVPAMIGLCILGYPAILAFSGKEFLDSVPVMQFLTPIVIITSMGSVIGTQTFVPMGRENLCLYGLTIGVITNILLNLILVPLYQVWGAAIATLVSQSVLSGVLLFWGRKIVDLKQVGRYFLLYLFNASVMGILVYICIRFIPGMWLSTGIAIFTGLLVYGIMLILEKNRFVMDFLKAIQRRLSRG